MKASLSPDRATVRLQGAVWGMTFPVAELGRWLAFYRGLAERRNPRSGGSYAQRYGDTVAELRRVKAEIAADGRAAA